MISQREVGHDSTTFAQALRAALRQDPDVILVGEMRDAETMEVALHAAETGHLVLSTLHTLNATETVNRIISTFPPHQEDQIRGQLAAVLQGIVSQRLVVRADGKGRVPRWRSWWARASSATASASRRRRRSFPRSSRRARRSTGCRRSTSRCSSLYREELITYETARDAATNPDDFDLKVKGIFSTGEMTWERRRARSRPSAARAARGQAERRALPEAVGAAARPLRARSVERPRWTRRPPRGGLRSSGAEGLEPPRAPPRASPPRRPPRGRSTPSSPSSASRGYLDDEAFARWWAEARAAGRRVGSVRLRQELRAKGIARELAAAAVAAAFEEASELERALDAGARRLPALPRQRRERVPGPARRLSPAPWLSAAVTARVVKALLDGAEDAGRRRRAGHGRRAAANIMRRMITGNELRHRFLGTSRRTGTPWCAPPRSCRPRTRRCSSPTPAWCSSRGCSSARSGGTTSARSPRRSACGRAASTTIWRTSAAPRDTTRSSRCSATSRSATTSSATPSPTAGSS